MSPGLVRVAILVAMTLGTPLGPGSARWTGVSGPRVAQASDPSLDWFTVESENFTVHYHSPLQDAAERVARLAERARQVLSPVLGWETEQRTHIVLSDDTDNENGSASVLPYNVITLFVTAPDSTSSLADYDDYLSELVIHEYVHILHMEHIHGLPRLVNNVFGRQWAPNAVAPPWFVEGLATYHESQQTTAGRVRSTAFDTILRTAVLEGRALRLDEVTNGPHTFPRGTTRYLYGGAFMKYLADRFGDPAMAALIHDYGGAPIPFAINRAARRAFGKTMDELWDDWMAHLRRKYGLQLDEVRARGVREGKRLTNTAETNNYPRYVAGGRELMWFESSGWDTPRYRVMPAGGGTARTVLAQRAAAGFALVPGGEGRFVFERTGPHKGIYLYQDLYHWDPRTRRRQRLTYGARASEPDVSPDGQKVAFVVNARGQRRLAVLDLGQALAPIDGREGPRAEIEIIVEPGRFEQIYSPSWSPDGRLIAYSGWSEGGFRDIHLVDVEARSTRRLTHDRASDQSPRFSHDGRFLYWSSDRSGIHNIYRYELGSGELRQVTNVEGGAYSPEPSPDGTRLAYVSFGARGQDLAELMLDDAELLEPVPFVTERPRAISVDDPRLPKAQVGKPKAYDPSGTILPKTYNVRLGRDAFGRAIGANTSGGDIIGRHQYAVDATVGVTHGHLQGGFFYAYNRLVPRLELSGRHSVFKAGVREDNRGSTINVDYSSLSSGVRLPLKIEADWGIYSSLGLSWERFRSLSPAKDATLDILEPGELGARRPSLGNRAAMNAGFFYNSAHGIANGVALMEGRMLSMNLGMLERGLGSDVEGVNLTWSWSEFFALPFRGHAASMRYSGGIAQAEDGPAAVFALGGLPDQSLQEIVQALYQNQRVGPPAMHGYPSGLMFGDQYHLLSVDWRFPLWNVERGISTLPVYANRLHAAAVFDAGAAFFGPFETEKLRYALAGELRQDLTLGWYLRATVVLGLAKGLSAGGVTDLYTLLSFPL